MNQASAQRVKRKSRQRDLFGRVIPPPRESALLSAVLDLLAVHPLVAWAARQNRGARINRYTRKDGSQGRSFVRFGWPGASDIIGQMRDGRFLAIETKRQGEKPDDDQLAFLAQVKRHGGAAGIAYSLDDARAIVEGRKGE